MTTQSSPTSASTDAAGIDASALNVALTVKDIAKSLAWYRDVFGFVVEEEFKSEGQTRGARMRAGAVRILINQDDGAKGWDRIKGQGFALQLVVNESVDEVAKRITDAGGTLALEPTDMPWGARVFRLEDCDGFKWSVSSPRR
jgi:uncharacterized glyoxalase superfamily protein PhnB